MDTKTTTHKLFARILTIHDKKSAFRPQNPPSYVFQLFMDGTNIIKEQWFGDKAKAMELYNIYKEVLSK